MNILFFILILLLQSTNCFGKEWKLISEFKTDKSKQTLIQISEYNLPIQIQLRNKDRVISNQVTESEVGMIEYLLLPSEKTTHEYKLFARPIYNDVIKLKAKINIKIIDKNIEKYQFIYNYSINNYGNRDSVDSLLLIEDFFFKYPYYQLDENEISFRYASLLYQLEQYQKLNNYISSLKNKGSNTNTSRLFMWLKAKTILNLGSYQLAKDSFKEILDVLEQTGELSIDWKINVEEIRASYGFTIALLSFYNNDTKIDGKKFIINSLSSLNTIGSFYLKSKILYKLAVYYTLIGDYQKSNLVLEFASENLMQSSSKDGLFLLYNQMASNYLMLNNMVKAQAYFRKIIVHIKPNLQPFIKASIYLNLANTYRKTGDLDRAYRYYQDSIKIYTILGSKLEYSRVMSYIATIERMRGDVNDAINMHKSSIEYFDKFNKKFLVSNLVELGLDYLKNNNLSQAKKENIKALILSRNQKIKYKDILDKNINNFNASDIKIHSVDEFNILMSLSKIALLEKNALEIETYFDILDISFSKINLANLQKLNYYNLKIDSLLFVNNFIEANQIAINAIGLINRIRSQFNVSDQALYWTNQANEILEKHISSLFEQKQYRASFEILEKYYAINLRESRQSSTTKINKLESQDIQQAFDNYVKLERDSILLSDSITQNKADEAKEHFLALNGDNQYSDSVELNYLDVDHVQAKLAENELLLRYYISNKQALVFVIDRTSFKVMHLPDESNLARMVKSIIDNIKSKRFNNTKLQDEFYAKILPLDKVKSGQYNKIIIIPDGILNLLPYASMNISSDSDQYLPLVDKINIERTYSASDYFAEFELPTKPNTISIFSNPVFLKNSKKETLLKSISKYNKLWEFDSLPNSDEEANVIQQIFPEFDINILSGKKATNKNFLSEKNRNSNIIHIATHGFFNDSSIENVGLATSIVDENNNEAPGFLAMREILYQPFKANLAVVSGCETTLGKVINGEGFNSLSRGLLSQGVNSVIGTIWSISDRATPVFMKEFYTNLRDMNGNVSEALNTTKVNFATKPQFRRYRHPYYWAGFVLTSSNKAISKNIFQ